MRTVAVVARKGGSGKTTVAVNLAIAAHLRGLATVLADSDPQRSSSDALKGRRSEGPGVVEADASRLAALQMGSVRGGVDFLVIDTQAGAEDELAHAIVLADLAVLVIRPTFLDFAAAIRTVEVIRRMKKPAMIVLNQAPPARAGVEPPAIRKAGEILRLMRLPVSPAVIRARAVHQTALESGRSAEEIEPGGAAAADIAELWASVQRTLGREPAEVESVRA